MILGIMQPYFFPYIGYWQLINAVDQFIILDDVTFIKQGYINRNTIIAQNKSIRINLLLTKISSNKLILEHQINDNYVWKKKLLATIKQNYSKSKQFKTVYPLIENIINYDETNLSKYLLHQITKITKFLNINTEIGSSSTTYNIKDKKGQDKIIEICKKEKADTYINAIGGKELYDKKTFEMNSINLKFIKTNNIKYQQYTSDFTPNLSIIDVMMFNSPENIRSMLKQYTLE